MRRALACLLLALPGPLSAETPRVAVDIAPLHSLVARVMGDAGTPELILPPGSTPHDFQLRPSQAATLAGADLVIWSGAGLVPWLAESLPGLAPDTPALALLETDGWTALDMRSEGMFAGGEDHHHDHADDADHEDHEDHGDHEAHGDAGDHGGDHDHGPHDPHAWLDPRVAGVWVGHIAEALIAADPGRADLYAANARAAIGDLEALDAELAEVLAQVADRPFLVPHDAYQYLEARYGLTAVGAITAGHGGAPGPARVSALRAGIAAGEAVCLLQDAETDPSWLDLVAGDTGVARALVDADGITLEPGPDLYTRLMRDLAAALAECLAD